MCTVLLPPGGYQITVKYAISIMQLIKLACQRESRRLFINKSIFPQLLAGAKPDKRLPVNATTAANGNSNTGLFCYEI